MQFKNWKQLIYIGGILVGLCLVLILFTTCRSVSSSIKVKSKIIPEPIVGEIVTLRVEVVSEKFSGDGNIWITLTEGINIVKGVPEWEGIIAAGEPIVHELSICVSEPGFSGIYIQTAVADGDVGEHQVNIYSTTNFAEIDPRSRYRQPPAGSTPTPTPEPVRVSPECAGENL